jgi:2-polyprenyl-6-methoxyphenol hydroxylase-like FAD-dependent oxidoreductase
MSPFGGVGVNVAMEDALKLWRAIIGRKDDILASDASVSRKALFEAIKEYEVEMFPRAKKSAELSNAGLEIRFSKNAAPKILNIFKMLASKPSIEQVQVGANPASGFHEIVMSQIVRPEGADSQQF